MKIFFTVVLIIIIAFILIKLYKLIKLTKMSSEKMINKVLNNNDNAKISLAIIKNGKVEYRVYGKNGIKENNTKYEYEIGSISKTFVGLLISKLIEEKRLNLNDSISKYLDLDNNVYYPTIERLLTHTSGYKSYYFDSAMITNHFNHENDFYKISKTSIFNKVKKIKLQNKDYKFKYSNFGISVLGLVLEKIEDNKFVIIMNNYIESILKLSNTKVAISKGNLKGYWKWKIDDGYISAGSIVSNIEDMSEYLKMYLTDKIDYIVNTYKPNKSVSAHNFLYDKMGLNIDQVGLTWLIDKKNNIVWHNGATSNFNSYIAFNKEKNIGVVLLSNTSPMKYIPMTLIGPKIMKEL